MACWVLVAVAANAVGEATPHMLAERPFHTPKLPNKMTNNKPTTASCLCQPANIVTADCFLAVGMVGIRWTKRPFAGCVAVFKV